LAIGYHPTAEISDEVRELLATKQLHFNEAAGPFSPAVKANRLARAKSLDELGTGLSPKMAAEVQRELRAACFHIAPLVARDELIGMMVIGSPIAASQLSDFQKNLLSQLKGAVAIAMDSTLLYAQLKEATAHLKEANQNLKELDKAKDDFISMASHQLRTPLTTIRGYLSMLAEGDAGAIAPQQKKFIDNALEGAFRMIGLIGELLNVSRLNTGRFTINRSACDVSALAADEVRRLQNFARERQLELKYVLPPTALPKAEIDEEKTRQVIMNFIDNALHYTPQGSVTVTLAATGHSVILKVTDTGIGVPKAARTKLFSKFYRAGNAMTARPDGTGLGLYVAKKVIEEQGGKILFDSTEGKGSMFGFELPLKAPQAK
jgi:signal transduction histidine kinase